MSVKSYLSRLLGIRHTTDAPTVLDCENLDVINAGDLTATTITGTTTNTPKLASEARGDIIRYGASGWAAHSAKTSGQILVGDGTDVASVAVSGDATLASTGALTIANAAVTVAKLHGALQKNIIPLDITTCKIISGDAIGNTTEGMLPDGNTDPILQRVNGATDKALRLTWAAGSVVEVQFGPIPYPPDLDDATSVQVKFIANMAGATDTPGMVVGYFEGVGDTNAGGTTTALSATVTTKTQNITAGDIGGPTDKFANITFTPGAHNTDALHLYAAWLEYTRAGT